jgi:hypothetical protein
MRDKVSVKGGTDVGGALLVDPSDHALDRGRSGGHYNDDNTHTSVLERSVRAAREGQAQAMRRAYRSR